MSNTKMFKKPEMNIIPATVYKNVADKRTIKVGTTGGMYKMRVNVTEPYVSVAITPTGLVHTGVHSPRKGEYLFHVKDKYVVMGSFLSRLYYDVNGEHLRDHGADINITTYMERSDDSFYFPSGIRYDDKGPEVDVSDFENLGLLTKREVFEELKATSRKMDEGFNTRLVCVTTVMTGERAFILVEDYNSEKHSKASSLETVQAVYGDYLEYFPTGTLQYTCRACDIVFPTAWIKYVQPRKGINVRKLKSSLTCLLTPADKQCMVDGKTLDPTIWKGQNAVMCSSCVEKRSIDNGALAEAVSVVEDYLTAIRSLSPDKVKAETRWFNGLI